MNVVSHQSYLPDLAPCNFSLYPQLKIKLEGRHFDINEVNEAELQAVLNILKEYDFQDEFKKMAEVLGMMRKREWRLCQG
jgi:hypothetical protein